MDAFELAISQQSEQGSPAWHNIRCGRFTSSEIFRLIKNGERLMTDVELKARPKSGPGSKARYVEDPTKFSDDGETYIYQKVAETLTGEVRETPYSHATAHGSDMEPLAAQYFIEKTGYTHEIVSFVPVGDHAGGSPDRYVNGDEILEIKCPFDSTNQVKYL